MCRAGAGARGPRAPLVQGVQHSGPLRRKVDPPAKKLRRRSRRRPSSNIPTGNGAFGCALAGDSGRLTRTVAESGGVWRGAVSRGRYAAPLQPFLVAIRPRVNFHTHARTRCDLRKKALALPPSSSQGAPEPLPPRAAGAPELRVHSVTDRRARRWRPATLPLTPSYLLRSARRQSRRAPAMSVLRGVMLLWTALIAAPAEASGVFDDVSELKAAVDDVTTAEETHGPLAEWDVSRVDEMSATPYKFFPSNFDGDVSKWDTARVTTFYKMVSATPRRGGAAGPSPAARSAAPRRATPPLTASRRSPRPASVRRSGQLQRRPLEVGYRERHDLPLHGESHPTPRRHRRPHRPPRTPPHLAVSAAHHLSPPAPPRLSSTRRPTSTSPASPPGTSPR